MTQTPVERAITAAGSGVALAKIVGVSPMAVSHWKVRGIPAHQVISIESATGVSRHELRPDIYPDASPISDEIMRQMLLEEQAGKPSVHTSSTRRPRTAGERV
ncbi:transcriptional regulator [Pseudomonas sp. ICMP 10191]|uniref:transcriptional regulator n=1 Tax=Pseudomonas sp. ICMP 10191 TaxID=1198294 RepID=UPI0009FB44CA|nr:YdaS family helix-turn-helix protein [Pseudomonas sp. ICMP 10191]